MANQPKTVDPDQPVDVILQPGHTYLTTDGKTLNAGARLTVSAREFRGDAKRVENYNAEESNMKANRKATPAYKKV